MKYKLFYINRYYIRFSKDNGHDSCLKTKKGDN